MYKRDHHRRIAALLDAFNSALLQEAQCYFAGGTAIVLLLGEYRESLDIDFICSSVDGYRMLRNCVSQQNLGALIQTPVKYFRGDVRIDRYGIRTFLEIDGLPIKVEIVSEGRITVSGEMHTDIPVPVLSRDDMFAEKLLANTDRGRDKSTMSRDIIDLAMMLQAWGRVPDAAWNKVKHVYGVSAEKAYHDAVALVSEPAYLAHCLSVMRMNADLVHQIPLLLKHEAMAHAHNA